MGLFNVFRLANDYAKLKKYLKKNKYKVDEVNKIVEKCLSHIEYLKSLRDQLNDFIKEIKDTVASVKDMLKGNK